MKILLDWNRSGSFIVDHFFQPLTNTIYFYITSNSTFYHGHLTGWHWSVHQCWVPYLVPSCSDTDNSPCSTTPSCASCRSYCCVWWFFPSISLWLLLTVLFALTSRFSGSAVVSLPHSAVLFRWQRWRNSWERKGQPAASAKKKKKVWKLQVLKTCTIEYLIPKHL